MYNYSIVSLVVSLKPPSNLVTRVFSFFGPTKQQRNYFGLRGWAPSNLSYRFLRCTFFRSPRFQ